MLIIKTNNYKMNKDNVNIIPIPQKHDIIHGYFFDRNQLTVTNKKVPLYRKRCHYMLVISSLPQYNALIVILGTSMKRDKYEYSEYKNDLIIKADIEHAGLNRETLFSINYNTIGMIKSTTEFLVVPEGKESVIVGSLSVDDKKRYEYRIDKYPQITNIAKKIAGTGSHMLSSLFYSNMDYKLPITQMKNK